MRNLKKILSLALALVMVFSLMTFASAKDFNDAGDIEYTEAVEVLTALEVIDGVGNNTFNPTGKVTRAQMAKMITLISLGNVSVDAFNGVTVDLNDIGGHWAEAYIKYCYSQGIISGKGNGRFDPDANVTTVEAAKMLLVALGYNSDVQVYEGPNWNVNVIRDAQNNDIFDDMTGMASDLQISRDQAAQMMYNTLNTGIIEKGSEQSREDGSISDTYTKNDNKTLLKQSFKADIWVGTFNGNDKVENSGTTVAGEIAVYGSLESNYTGAKTVGSATGYRTAAFPFDFDVAKIGEEVKVIFKDGTMGVKGQPDKYDTIYGVYTTGGTTVYNITRGDLQDAESDTAKNKIKFGGSKYELSAANIPVVLNYAESADWTAAQINKSNHENPISAANGLRGQSVDTIKFIANDEGKLIKAYVTEYSIGRVAAVTSSKITIEGVGAINIEGNDIYDGIAVDDVVVYTRFYDKDSKDDAYFVVTLAESIEGELTGFKAADNVVVDGTTYKLNRKTLKDVSDDEILAVASTHIGTDVRAYLVNGMIAAIQKTEEKGGKYALVLEVGSGTSVGGVVNGVELNLLLADGTEQTAYIHKDSTVDGSAPLNTKSQIPLGALVEYSSISDGKIKIYKVADPAAAITATDSAGNAKVWNKDTKALTYTGTTTAVAASNATLFVLVDADGDSTIDPSEKTYAYNLRELGNIANTSGTGVKVACFRNDSGLISAAYAVLSARPGSGTASTLYGIVTGYTGARRDTDDTDFQLFTVAVNGGEVKEVRIEAVTEAAARIKKGDLVSFDETTNGEYAPADFDILVTADETPAAGWTLGAVDSYKSSSNLLTYFTTTEQLGSTSNPFTGRGSATSVTTDKDVKIIYVNGKDNKAGDEVGVGKFGTEFGYANILFHTDDDEIVDVMIVESTGEANLAKVGGAVGTDGHKPDKKQFATANFGTGYTAPLTPTADVALALTTPSGAGNTITTTGTGSPKTVAVNVVNNTSSVVITGAKTAAQTVAIGGTDAAKVSLTTSSDTAPVWTVNTSTVAAAGGAVAFTLTVSEDGKSSVTYNVTVTVAAPGAAVATADMALTLTTPSGAGNTIAGGGATKTVAVNVVNATNSVVLTGTKTAAQTVEIDGTDKALVTAGGSDTAPTYTVNTTTIASAGGSKTFTLKVSETGKTAITYTVTVTVATPAPAPAVKNLLGEIDSTSTANDLAISRVAVKDSTGATIAKDAEMAAGDYTIEVSFTDATVSAATKVTLTGVTAKASANATASGTGVTSSAEAPDAITIAAASVTNAKVVFTFTVAAATGSSDTTITPVITLANA